ncbi:unnamed protein product, partial [Hapterophycus canaliculatus]
MAHVAWVQLLSVPAPSTVLERDFSTAGRLITGPRISLGGAYTEMVLFLNGNQEYIPVEVPALSAGQVLDAMPTRLSNPNKTTECLSTGEVEEEGGDDFA